MNPISRARYATFLQTMKAYFNKLTDEEYESEMRDPFLKKLVKDMNYKRQEPAQ